MDLFNDRKVEDLGTQHLAYGRMLGVRSLVRDQTRAPGLDPALLILVAPDHRAAHDHAVCGLDHVPHGHAPTPVHPQALAMLMKMGLVQTLSNADLHGVLEGDGHGRAVDLALRWLVSLQLLDLVVLEAVAVPSAAAAA